MFSSTRIEKYISKLAKDTKTSYALSNETYIMYNCNNYRVFFFLNQIRLE